MVDLIHVIDDDAAVRNAVGFLLASTGFEVKLYDGSEVLLAALAHLGDGCILSDIRMPGMGGLDLLRRLDLPRFSGERFGWRCPSRTGWGW